MLSESAPCKGAGRQIVIRVCQCQMKETLTFSSFTLLAFSRVRVFRLETRAPIIRKITFICKRPCLLPNIHAS